MNKHTPQKIPIHCYVGKAISSIQFGLKLVKILIAGNRMCAGKEVVSKKNAYPDRPREGAVCTVFLSNLYVEDTSNFMHSEYFKPDVDIRDLCITIGEADCELDRGLEKALCCMDAGEESKVHLSRNGQEITVFVKLIKFDNPPPVFEWPDDKKLRIASNHKEKG